MLSYTAFDKMGVGPDPSGGVLVRNCDLLLALLGMANTARNWVRIVAKCVGKKYNSRPDVDADLHFCLHF